MNLKKSLNRFINNPVKVFICFVLVNLIPSLGLLFTEPFDIWGKVILILFPLGLYLIVFSLLKRIGLTQLVLIPLLVLHAFQIVVFYLFGEEVIAVDMFLNVITTSINEAGELLGGLMVSIVFVVLVYVPTIIMAIVTYRRKIQLNGKFRVCSIIIGLILIIFSGLLGSIATNKNTLRFTFYEDAYPANVFYNLNYARQKWVKSRNYPKTSRDFTFEAVKSKTAKQREVYVLVIGETSRADNWGLYGYERNTTPSLQRDTNIVVLQDALTQSNTTHKSVSIILTTASAEKYEVVYEQKSILTAFKEAGFTTLFLSNQSANHTFTDYFGQEADYTKYFRFFNEKTNNYDDTLLVELEHALNMTDDNLFIILHTYGSHFNYKERYPEEYAVFKPDNITQVSRKYRDILVNAYDNTLLYTDHILSELITILEKTNSCVAFFYSSDHGEDILDDKHQRFLHASPNPSYYQLRIPMFMWFSPTYKDNFPQIVTSALINQSKPVTTNAIFHTLLDIAAIETPYKNEDLSLVSEKFKVVERMYLTDHDKPIPFYRAGLKSADREMIEVNKIAY